MRLNDPVYGSAEVTEPLLVALIESPALQRLKGISQNGYMTPWHSGATTSRFDHSVGVMLMLCRAGTSVEEQAAGLIHDVSHGVFSHAIDYLRGEADWEFQDRIMGSFLQARTDLPARTAAHGYPMDLLLDDARHPLKERPLPDVCADRLDYSLRDGLAFGVLSRSEARRFLDALTAENGRWVFRNLEAARAFSEMFRVMSRDWWSGFPSAVAFTYTVAFLRHALKAGYVTEDDLYGTESDFLARANARTDDAAASRLWRRMHDPNGWRNDPSQPDARIVCKSRMVDPLVKTAGGPVRLSVLQPDWAGIVAAESAPREWFPVYDSARDT